MRESRSVANALFCFFLFLLVHAFTVPGSAKGLSAPRFLKMEIRDAHSGSHEGERIALAVPFGLVEHGLKAATASTIRRELSARFDESIEGEELRSLVKELTEAPAGTELKKTYGDSAWTFVRADGTVTATVSEVKSHDGEPEEAAEPIEPKETKEPKTTEAPGTDKVTLRFPAALLDDLAKGLRPLDVDALVASLSGSAKGSLLEIEGRDGKVRISIE
jgi:hypothetical protein